VNAVAAGATPMTRRADAEAEGRGARANEIRWGRFLILPALVSLGLLALPQASFVWMSFHEDLGLGQVGNALTLRNYATIVSDPFYLGSIWLTVYLSAGATAISLTLGFPTAYALARIGGWRARVVLSLVLTTSLITIVIKLMGLNLLLDSAGLVNGALLALGLVAAPIAFVNSQLGVLIGLVQYTLPILILMLFSVVQTIPQSLEEAAAIHGASRGYVFARIVLPLARSGLVGGGLIAFNMSMGAFTSAVLLGGGRVKTMPVLIQEKMIQSTDYAMGAALSTTLLLLVFLMNVAIAGTLMRARARKAR
jgi:putative spermidine/putrescine transport system permease protein